MRLKNAQNYEHDKNILDADQRPRTFIYTVILYKIVEILCFSANIRQCNIAYNSVVHVQFCLKSGFVCFYVAFVPKERLKKI